MTRPTQGVFLPIGRDAQGYDEPVIAKVRAVYQQRHEIETIEWSALPGRDQHRCPGDEAPADRAPAVPRLVIFVTDRLQASCVLARGDATSIYSTPVEGGGGRHRREHGHVTSPAAVRTRGR